MATKAKSGFKDRAAVVSVEYLAAAIDSQRSIHTDLQPSEEAAEWADWRLSAIAQDLAEYLKDKVDGFDSRAFEAACGFPSADVSVGNRGPRVDLVIEVEGGCVTNVYDRKTGLAVDHTLRDLDNIKAGDEDPLA